LSTALPSSQSQSQIQGAAAIADYPTATLRASASHHSDSKTVFVGRSLPEFDQELFLGIKYADQPVRFTPSSLKRAYGADDSNSGPYQHAGLALEKGAVLYNATQYGHECPGYGSDETKLVNMGLITLHEDCLNLNIVRPTRKSHHEELLPVMIWIFGGGWQQGATADPRYGY
jgi:triacylglycerol lipase